MILPLTFVLSLGCLALGLVAVVRAIVGRQPGWIEVIGAGIAEVLLVVQAIASIVGLVGGHRLGSTPTFVGYLIASLLLLPVAIVWATAEKERSRWSSLVLAVGFFAIAVVELRMDQVWAGG